MIQLRPLVLAGTRVSAALALIGWADQAQAHPQWNTGLVASGCLLGRGDAAFERAGFCGQARGDVLFLRARTSDFGLGPYLALGTAAFDDLRVSAGVSALVPVTEDFPFVLSIGALTRDADSFGVSSSLFWGLRSYNFHSGYNLAFGLSLAGERTFGTAPSNALLLGVQVDGLVLVLPFLLLIGAAQ